MLKEDNDLCVLAASSDAGRNVHDRVVPQRADDDKLRLHFRESVRMNVSRATDAANDLVGMAFHERNKGLAHEGLDDNRGSTVHHGSLCDLAVQSYCDATVVRKLNATPRLRR